MLSSHGIPDRDWRFDNSQPLQSRVLSPLWAIPAFPPLCGTYSKGITALAEELQTARAGEKGTACFAAESTKRFSYSPMLTWTRAAEAQTCSIFAFSCIQNNKVGGML